LEKFREFAVDGEKRRKSREIRAPAGDAIAGFMGIF
jgi:hypothetical protein